MQRVKGMGMLTGFAALVAVTAAAQAPGQSRRGPGRPEGPGGPDGPPPPMMRAVEELGLDDAQRERAREIFEAARPEMERLREEMRRVRERMEADFAAVLTPAQRQRWEEMRRERGPRQGGGRPGGPPPREGRQPDGSQP